MDALTKSQIIASHASLSLQCHCVSSNAIQNKTEMGILTIHLDKVTNLKDEDTMGKSDPYVKVSRLHAALKFE